MKKMRYVAAPVAAVALAVSGAGAGVAAAGPLDAAGQGIATGMGIGGSVGKGAGMLLGSSDELAAYKDVPGVLLQLAGGSVGLILALTQGQPMPALPF